MRKTFRILPGLDRGKQIVGRCRKRVSPEQERLASLSLVIQRVPSSRYFLNVFVEDKK